MQHSRKRKKNAMPATPTTPTTRYKLARIKTHLIRFPAEFVKYKSTLSRRIVLEIPDYYYKCRTHQYLRLRS